jgi:hypothetical protein
MMNAAEQSAAFCLRAPSRDVFRPSARLTLISRYLQHIRSHERGEKDFGGLPLHGRGGSDGQSGMAAGNPLGMDFTRLFPVGGKRSPCIRSLAATDVAATFDVRLGAA